MKEFTALSGRQFDRMEKKTAFAHGFPRVLPVAPKQIRLTALRLSQMHPVLSIVARLRVPFFRLPTIADQRTDFSMLNPSHRRHRFIAQHWQVRSPAVVSHLFRTLTPGDGASDRIKHQNPPQGELAHRTALRS